MTSAERPIPRGGVLDINAYVPGRSEAPGAAKVFKLSRSASAGFITPNQNHDPAAAIINAPSACVVAT